MAYHPGNPGSESQRLDRLQEGIVKKCPQRRKKVSGHQVKEIGFWAFCLGCGAVLFFTIGKEAWRVVG